MILVHGSVVARADCFDDALALSQQHVVRSRAEPGCIAHAVHRDTENPRRLVFVEQWADQAALWDHFKLQDSRAFAKALAALAAEAPEMSLYETTRLEIPGRGTA
ncbi:MAG: putative quinol monooxygenase [Burkholderiaceae bacterium]